MIQNSDQISLTSRLRDITEDSAQWFAKKRKKRKKDIHV